MSYLLTFESCSLWKLDGSLDILCLDIKQLHRISSEQKIFQYFSPEKKLFSPVMS